LPVERAGEILGAFECKSTANVSSADLTGLKAFGEAYPKTSLYVVAPEKEPRKIGDVTIVSPPTCAGYY